MTWWCASARARCAPPATWPTTASSSSTTPRPGSASCSPATRRPATCSSGPRWRSDPVSSVSGKLLFKLSTCHHHCPSLIFLPSFDSPIVPKIGLLLMYFVIIYFLYLFLPSRVPLPNLPAFRTYDKVSHFPLWQRAENGQKDVAIPKSFVLKVRFVWSREILI